MAWIGQAVACHCTAQQPKHLAQARMRTGPMPTWRSTHLQARIIWLVILLNSVVMRSGVP